MLGLLGVAMIASVLTDGANGAASTVVVTATVPTATNISTTGCADGGAATSFGNVLPGSSQVTTAGGTITFGSSNSTASLRMSQVDGQGTAFNRASNGAADGGWGAGGTATLARADDDYAGGIGLQSTGMVVQAFGGTDFHASRFTSAGAIDLTFGTAGVASKDVAADDMVDATAVQPDDAIVFAGHADGGAGPKQDTIIGRFLPGGGVDTGFGTNGVVEVDVGSSRDDEPYSILLQPDGKIVVSGWYSVGGIEHSYILRLTSAGALDTGFAGSGVYKDTAGPDVEYRGNVVQQSDGKLVALGMGYTPVHDLDSYRLSTVGMLDPTYGTSGRRSIDFAPGQGEVPESAAILDGDRILVAGNVSGTQFIARLTANGARDNTWGTLGYLTPHVAGQSDEWRGSTMVADDGKVLAIGRADVGSNDRMAAYRFSSTGVPDATFGTAGSVLLPGTSDFHPNQGGMLTQDGRIVIGARSTSVTVIGRSFDSTAVRRFLTTAARTSGPAHRPSASSASACRP